MSNSPVAFDAGMTLHELTTAVIDAFLAGKPLVNPAFEGITRRDDGKWLRVSYEVKIDVLDEMPPEALAAMVGEQGKVQ